MWAIHYHLSHSISPLVSTGILVFTDKSGFQGVN